MTAHVVNEPLGISGAGGEGAHPDSAENAVAGDNDRCRWVELHGVLHPQLDVINEGAVDELR